MLRNLRQLTFFGRNAQTASGLDVSRSGHGTEQYDGGVQAPTSFTSLSTDVLERVCHYLEVRDIVTVSLACKLLRHVATAHGVWSDLLIRTFTPDELPYDVSFLASRETAVLRTQFWKLTLQRPAFLSDAARTSGILEHAGSRFRKVLHIDGRRDLNFSAVFRDTSPGHYRVVWRLMLQPGFVRGYCNFRAEFNRPLNRSATSPPATSFSGAVGRRVQRPISSLSQTIRHLSSFGGLRLRLRARRAVKPAQSAASNEGTEERTQKEGHKTVQEGRESGSLARGRLSRLSVNRTAKRTWRLPQPLCWLPGCGSAADVGVPSGRAGAANNSRSGDGNVQRYRVTVSRSMVMPSPSTQAMYGDAAPAKAQQTATMGTHVSGSIAAVEAARLDSGQQLPAAAISSQLQLSRQSSVQHQHQHQQQLPPHPEHAALSRPESLLPLMHSQEQQQQHQLHPSHMPGPLQQPPSQPGIFEIEPLMIPAPAHPQGQTQPPTRTRPPHIPPPSPQRRPGARVSSSRPAVAASYASSQRPPELQRARGQLASAAAKLEAALATSGASRRVPRWLSPLWGSHSCSWQQLDPAGPLGQGSWRSVMVGGLTVRRRADVQLHGVMVQLRPMNAAQQMAAMPAGESRWRGVLIDYVELVPVRQGGLLEGLLPGFVQAPVRPELPRPDGVITMSRA